MNETREMAEFVYKADYQDLPPDLISSFKVFVLDTLASPASVTDYIA